MIRLQQDRLEVQFPEVHRDAVLRIDFERTLRIPDDDEDYPLPPGLGRFPLRNVDEYASGVPESWIERGGALAEFPVALPLSGQGRGREDTGESSSSPIR